MLALKEDLWVFARVCTVAALLLAAGAAVAQDDRIGRLLDTLVAAYPAALAGHDTTTLRWRDGSVMPITEGNGRKTFDDLLRHASIADQFSIAYPRGELKQPPAIDSDPGRFRNTAFFTKMYGDCKTGAVARRLVRLVWLPKTWGKPIRFTSVNGAEAHLRAVSAELDELPPAIKRAAFPIAGTYNCRTVADTGEPSPHGYGIAIDLNLKFSDYWFWQQRAGKIAYRNRMPQEIVSIFEEHGFIWGGKWYHYDTMHFEYRPELLSGG